MTNSIRAGNIVRITRTFPRLEGSVGSVNPSTAKVAVTTPAGITTPLVPTVTYNGDNSAVIVTADWTIADTDPGWLYTITIDISGNMVAAWQERVQVLRRTAPTLP